MIQGIGDNLSLGRLSGGSGAAPTSAAGAAGASGGTTFADTLKNSIDEVARMQQDASQAVTDVATGKSDNLTGVMTAVEKADMAFKTLLAIRSKLMEAYDEVKNIPL